MLQYIADYLNIRRNARGNVLFTRRTQKGQYFWGKGTKTKEMLKEVRRQINEQATEKPVHKARFGGIFVDAKHAKDVYECLMHDCGCFMAMETGFGVIIDTRNYAQVGKLVKPRLKNNAGSP